MKLKFRSKFNHGFTNLGYLHGAVWKALHNFKIKRARQATHNQFSLQIFKIMRSLGCSKFLKTTAEMTFTTQKANTCGPLNCIVLYLFAIYHKNVITYIKVS